MLFDSYIVLFSLVGPHKQISPFTVLSEAGIPVSQTLIFPKHFPWLNHNSQGVKQCHFDVNYMIYIEEQEWMYFVYLYWNVKRTVTVLNCSSLTLFSLLLEKLFLLVFLSVTKQQQQNILTFGLIKTHYLIQTFLILYHTNLIKCWKIRGIV